MKIYFATSNKAKVSEFRGFFRHRGIKVCQLDIDIPEIQHEGVADVAREKAKYAAEKTGKIVVVEDTGLYIAALKGFPGTAAKFVFFTIGLKGILKLMEGAKDRSAEFHSAIAVCGPGKELKVFVGREKGTISEEIRGNGGFGYDPVFIPLGHAKTHAEDYDKKSEISHRVKALEKLAGFLQKKS